MINKRLSFIGGGNMAEAMIKGLLDKEVAEASALVVSEPRKERRQHLSRTYKVLTVPSNKTAVKKGEIIVLAVKPQVMPGVLEEIAPLITSQHMVVSIAAGISISFIISFLGKERCVIRAMPNTPTQIGIGATALCGNEAATTDALHIAQALFDAIGVTVLVNEAHMDAVTGLSGSGPAYVFLIIEALTDGGVKMGLPRDVSQLLALQTIIGACRMVTETGKHPGQLKDLVTSPGGTTIRGLHVLEKKGVRAALVDAVEKATERSRELAKAIKRES